MKNRIYLVLFLTLLISAISYAQPKVVFKKHLFLGKWQLISDKYNIVEEWSYISDTLYTGRTYMTVNGDTSIIETLRLCYLNKIFCYCSAVPNQNDGKEIVFKLKHIENFGEKLTFENPSHDFPQKIVYEFFSNNQMSASIEGMKDGINKKTEYKFSKIPSLFDIGTFTGKFLRKQFVNKAGRAIDGVYDYYFSIEEKDYFIRFKDGGVTLKELEEYTNKEVRLEVMFHWGLWDTDEENIQSRIGSYVNVLGIIPPN